MGLGRPLRNGLHRSPNGCHENVCLGLFVGQERLLCKWLFGRTPLITQTEKALFSLLRSRRQFQYGEVLLLREKLSSATVTNAFFFLPDENAAVSRAFKRCSKALTLFMCGQNVL